MSEEMEQTEYYIPTISKFSVRILLQNYGWHILIGILVSVYVYEKFLKTFIDDLKRKQDDADYSAKYHKNPDLHLSRLEAQERRTRELQETYIQKAEEHKKKMEEKEEKKRQEMADKLRGSGHRLGSKDDDSNNSLRPDHNPLMGHGSSSNYRPPRRSACSRGGCG